MKNYPTRNFDFDISFIIPTYNRANEVTNAIDSVIAQTDPRWELIVVDDGSTDETSQVIHPYLVDRRINYFFQENLGVSIARNTYAKVAAGKYLIFLDSDDVLFPELINKLYQNDFLNFDLIFWDVIQVINGKISKRKPLNLGKMYNKLYGTFLAGSVCYRKKMFWNFGGYDPLMTFGENYELGLRISQKENLKTKYIKEVFLKYTIDTTTRTSNSFSNRLNSHLHQFEKHKEKYKKDPPARATMNYLIGFILEKTDNKTSALEYYRNSWYCTPWNLKALKVLFLNLFK
ncbi:glycosyltransferase family 2 protein [Antarcticibacterium sp. 1MA-6-2]|uniref:glycosyltransferase family 2 protein n=1 Tax=Antarcticibacterium sp. 1MA-6-2 TaxID=2908210 RepID=UPI001F28A254|nr:glycosyltransferase family A protein [Antarcticibacterium sp. 1MA-6-2]UJH91326.1 glycosyltransferase family 2 protein [Antarcticibacterium sp. 1MA-6-2]